MSKSLMKQAASLNLLYCGVRNGRGGSCSRNTAETLYQKNDDELDGYIEDTDTWIIKSDINHVQPVDIGCGELEKETRNLLSQFYRSYTGLECKPEKKHRALPSLHRVVEKVLYKHSIAYNGMVQQLFDQASGLESVKSVLRGVFSDGVISWGRIASVLALGAVVCERLKQDRMKEHIEQCVDEVASYISTYLSTELQFWFINNNGWDGFVDFFHVEDPESTVRKTLMAVAGFGIGACLFSLMR